MHKLLALAKSIYYTAEVLYNNNGHCRQVAIMGRGEGKYKFFALFKMV